MSRTSARPFRSACARLSLVGLLLTLACSRPLDRPLQGAPPVHGEVSSGLLVEPPPTLTVPGGAVPLPSPMVPVAPTPSPSPALAARAPILSGLAPAPDAQVPHGPVSIAARIAG